MNRPCILTTFNYQIEQDVISKHNEVMTRITQDTGITYIPLRYNLPRKFILHWQTIEYGLQNLFGSFDGFLILDVDCVPLSKSALIYTFEQIEKNILIGTAQRSMHIENNKHVYVGSPCVGFTKDLYRELGYPSFVPTERGDTAEELTYKAEELNKPIEIFRPISYEADPFGGPAWELETPDVKYGIGTTFVNSDNKEMFYHLFESRRHVNNKLFLNKCKEILYDE